MNLIELYFQSILKKYQFFRPAAEIIHEIMAKNELSVLPDTFQLLQKEIYDPHGRSPTNRSIAFRWFLWEEQLVSKCMTRRAGGQNCDGLTRNRTERNRKEASIFSDPRRLLDFL